LFTPTRRLCPPQVGECYTQRWSRDTTFQACRAQLKREAPKCDGPHTVFRCTPCGFGLYTSVVLRSLQPPALLRVPIMLAWRGQSTTTFAEMRMCVRRGIWPPWFVQPPMTAEPCPKRPGALQQTSLSALAPAAEMAHSARRQEQLSCPLDFRKRAKVELRSRRRSAEDPRASGGGHEWREVRGIEQPLSVSLWPLEIEERVRLLYALSPRPVQHIEGTESEPPEIVPGGERHRLRYQ
jgi:hypothetical protein